MKKNTKRLNIDCETVRQLQVADLTDVIGGATKRTSWSTRACYPCAPTEITCPP